MRNSLKNALPFIAGALAGKQGVKVLQGEWAKTNCVDTIWLPPLPDDDPKTKVKALGFVGHETAHISFTDNGDEITKLINQQKNRNTFFGTMNLLEDIRIEKKQKSRFPGVSDNLDALTEIMVEEGGFKAPTEDLLPIQIMQGWMLAKLRLDILKQKALQPLADEADTVVEKMLPLNMRIRLEALAYDVENASSTLDVFHLTKAIMEMIEEEAQKEEEKEKEQESAQQQQQSQQSQSDQSSDADQSQGSDAEDDGNDDASSGSSASGQDDGDDSADASDNSASGQGSTDVDDSSDATSSQGSPDGQKMSETLKGILNAGNDDQYKDIGDVLAEQLNEVAAKSAVESYDGSGPMRVFNAIKSASKGRNADYDFEARRAVNALKLKLHNMLQSQTWSSSMLSNSGSRFSPRHLHEVAIGGKVFEKRTEGINIDLAACFLIDISGSMQQNNKLKIAALSGYATAEALASVHGVTTAVSVFPTSDGVEYISPFGTKPVANAENFNQLTVYGDTPLSDAMARVSIDLLNQQNERKILFVITDGEPNYNDQSASVIESAVNAGIEIMGVGIGVELDHLFDVWCSIDNLQDLPGSIFSMLSNRLSHKKAA